MIIRQVDFENIDPVQEGVMALYTIACNKDIKTPEQAFKSLKRPNKTEFRAWKFYKEWSDEMYLRIFDVKNEFDLTYDYMARELFNYKSELDIENFKERMDYAKNRINKKDNIITYKKSYSNEELIELFIQRYCELGRQPKAKEFKQYRTVKNHFDSWDNFVKMAIEKMNSK